MTDWRESRQHWPSNGTEVQLGMILGGIQAETRQQTAILVRISDTLEDLPDRIGSRLSEFSKASAPAAPTTGGLSQILDSGKGLLQAALPVIIILGAIFKRIAMPDLPAILKAALGS